MYFKDTQTLDGQVIEKYSILYIRCFNTGEAVTKMI